MNVLLPGANDDDHVVQVSSAAVLTPLSISREKVAGAPWTRVARRHKLLQHLLSGLDELFDYLRVGYHSISQTVVEKAEKGNKLLQQKYKHNVFIF